MTVRFDFTKDDLVTFCMYHYSKSGTVRRQKWLGLFSCIALWLSFWGLLGILSQASEEKAPLLWPAFGATPLLAGVYLFYLRSARRRILEGMFAEGKNRGLLGPKEITLTPVEITAAGDLRSTTIRWKGVERIVETDTQVLIYCGALDAVVVPRRAFASDADLAAWVETASRYQAGARG